MRKRNSKNTPAHSLAKLAPSTFSSATSRSAVRALKANTQVLNNSEKEWDSVCGEDSSQSEHISPAMLKQIEKNASKGLKSALLTT